MKRNKKDWITIFIYELDSNTNHRIDFSGGGLLIEDLLFIPLFDSFNITQIIPKESTYNSTPDNLDLRNIRYIGTTGTIKYGLFKQKSRIGFMSDLILPHASDKYIYEFTFGSYFYVATNKGAEYDIESIVKWYSESKFTEEDKDELYSGNINENFSFPEFLDFILISNYDNNLDLGIVLKADKSKIIIDWIKNRITDSQIEDFEYNIFENCKRTRLI